HVVGNGGPAAFFAEDNRVAHRGHPFHDVAVCIGKLVGGDETHRALDFVKSHDAAGIFAVGAFHAVVPDAAGPEIDVADRQRPAPGTPPVVQMFTFGKGVEYQLAWSVECAGEGQSAVVNLMCLFHFALHFYSSSLEVA